MATSEPPSIAQDPSAALTADFARTARVVFAAGTVRETLDQVLQLAVSTIDGCDYAGIVLVDGDTVASAADTDRLVLDLHELQRLTGQGPGLDAIGQNSTYYVDDLADDFRWPRFGYEATARGIRSQLALPLLTGSARGSLCLYAGLPRAFGVIDRAKGLLLAGLAGLALTTARDHEDAERRTADLHAALATRELIGQAQGILIERERITAEQAFDVLRRASQHLNRKLRDVAQTLVDTGEDPDTGPRTGTRG
jgi:GAF domain-containing protein